MQSDSIAELTKAMVQVQAELGPVTKDKKNPFFGSMYADLGAIIEASRPLLTKHGLAILQFPGPSRFTHEEKDKDGHPVAYGVVSLATIVAHTSGEWMEWEAENPCRFGDPQRAMAARTYLRRDAMQAVVGIAAEEDDDGNTATRGAQSSQEERSAPAEGEDGVPICPHHNKSMKQRKSGHWYCSTPIEKDDDDKVTKWCDYQPPKGPTAEDQSVLDSEPPGDGDPNPAVVTVMDILRANDKETKGQQLAALAKACKQLDIGLPRGGDPEAWLSTLDDATLAQFCDALNG